MVSGDDNTGTTALTLVKGAERWSFACAPGDEPELLGALFDLADRTDSGIDWFDAALISHRLGQRLIANLQSFSADGARS